MGQIKLSDSLILEADGANWGSSTYLPKGSILQLVYNTTTTEKTQTSSTAGDWTGLATNITPISSTSHLWVWINAVRLIVDTDSNEARIFLSDGSNSTASYRLRNYDSDNNYKSFTPNHNWYWPQTHTAGTQITLTPELLSLDNSNNAIWGDSGSSSMMFIWEIAQ